MPDPRKEPRRICSDIDKLAGSVSFVPALRRGKPHGFQLFRIRPGSLFAELGLLDGDLIVTVDGRAVDDPAAALELSTSLRSAAHVTVVVERDGHPRRLRTEIR